MILLNFRPSQDSDQPGVVLLRRGGLRDDAGVRRVAELPHPEIGQSAFRSGWCLLRSCTRTHLMLKTY